MDPYLGYSASPMQAPSASMMSTKTIMISLCCLVLIGIGAYVFMRRSSAGPTASEPDITDVTVPSPPKKVSSSSGGTPLLPDETGGERRWETDPPEARLAVFAFESKTRPGFVPDKKGRIAQKPAGNPPYKLVGCQYSGAYAIRWNSRYLTVISPNSVKWTEDKQEPGSCFKIVPGHCNAKEYVMLRSMSNKLFLRADASSGLLVCKDIPTARTADSYCWKLNPEMSKKQPCGPQYSYDLGRIVDVPCNVTTTPKPGESCSSVTPGYRAKCCLSRGPEGQHDAYCESTIFPKVVGRSLQEAMLYLRTRRPDLALKPCPEPCTVEAVPIQNPNLVVIPYDARSNLVTSIPRRLE